MLTTREDKFLSTLSKPTGIGSGFPRDKASFIQEFSQKISELKAYTLRKHVHKLNVMLTSAGVLAHESEGYRREIRLDLLADAAQYLINYNDNFSGFPDKTRAEFSWEKLDMVVSSLHRLLMDDVCLHEAEYSASCFKFRKIIAGELIKYQREEINSATSGTLFMYTYNVIQESIYKHILDLYTALEEGNVHLKEASHSINELMSRCNGIRINSKSLQHAEKKYAKAVVNGENIYEAREVLDRKIGICFNLTNEISDLLEEATDLLEDDGSDLRGEQLDAVH